jgi:hypothetical protein
MHIADPGIGTTLAHGVWNRMILGTALGVCLAIWILSRSWRYLAPQTDGLGTVSEQWLAEHRLDRTDSQR